MSDQRLTQIHTSVDAGADGTSETPLLDIVFIHGLGGDRRATWTNADDGFWPQWLVEDFPRCRVFIAGYESGAFGSIKTGSGASIQDLAGSLADELASMHPPSERLLIVAHSLGGLVTKQMLRRCKDSANKTFVQVGRAVCGVVFLGTPHVGSQLSNALDVIIRNCKSKQTQQLSYAADALLDLNEFFRNHAAASDLRVGVYYETQKTWGAMVVDRVTANPNVLGAEPIALEADHIGICKPSNKDSKLYVSMCRFIRDLLSEADAPGGEQASGSDGDLGTSTSDSSHGAASDTLSEYGYFTATAADDRRSLEQKLKIAGRSYQIKQAALAKERFAMALQRNIAQPSAVARYTRLMADVESRYNRHVMRAIAQGATAAEIDNAIQNDVVDPCNLAHSSSEHPLPVSLVDGALYYLAGNCHLAFDNE